MACVLTVCVCVSNSVFILLCCFFNSACVFFVGLCVFECRTLVSQGAGLFHSGFVSLASFCFRLVSSLSVYVNACVCVFVSVLFLWLVS